VTVPVKLTHWATWDAARYKRYLLAACGAHVTERELAIPGETPTCTVCMRHFREFENLHLTSETGD
jgi:hypothetical protein